MELQEQNDYRATKTLERLMPRVRAEFGEATGTVEWVAWEARLTAEWPRLWSLLFRLYGTQHDLYFHIERLLQAMARSWIERPVGLKRLDAERAEDPHWFESHRMLGGVCYVDLFAGDLAGVRERIPYFRELGLTYLHLMPLFAAPEGNSDGGYAVSSYREVDSRLGTIDGLRTLAEELRSAGISLVLDFVFNHTSDEHTWARRARAGDPEYREFYYLFPDRTMPDAYERTLREIFPTVRRGSFTWRPELQRWVWTTFNSFQWDLRYANPAVLVAMAEEMLFLANAGVEFLRLDAVAFIWKQLGTSCENLPEAHLIIQAFNAIARIAAPALLFKSEAIVHPDDVISYVEPRRVPDFLQPPADGAAMGSTGDARRQAAFLFVGETPSLTRRHGVGQLSALARRHRLDLRRRRRALGLDRSAWPPAVLERLLYRPFSRLICARRAVSGKPGDR